MAAPVTAIVGYDLKFYEHPPKGQEPLSGFADKPERAQTVAFRNGSLQGAYLIMAARALGLDCGPMSGFDNAGVDKEFFAGTDIKSNFLCNLGYGDPTGLRPRAPALRLRRDGADRLMFWRRRVHLIVMPGLVPGIQPTASVGPSGAMRSR